MPLQPYSGPFTKNEVIHLLKRTTFGAKKADVDYFLTKSLSDAVDELLNPASVTPDPPVKEYQNSEMLTPDLIVPEGQTWVNDVNLEGEVQLYRMASFKKWMAGLMLHQDRSILEKMTLFWVNHFGNEAQVVQNANLLYYQDQLLRSLALGNFKDMVRAVTIDGAMLIYLNGQYNAATAPDENYARELQELFTLGKGPGSQYTEDDVQEAARVLTGWRVSPNDFQVNFLPGEHDTGTKQFSSFYNNAIINGVTGPNGGMDELNQLLDMIFVQDEVAKFIARKVYRWFVYYEITPQIEADVIEPLADTFRSNNYEIKPMLTELFNSQHFFDTVISQGAVIKSPVDLTIGAMREFNMQSPPLSDYETNYEAWGTLAYLQVQMGQNVYDPPGVAGWPAYYQVPSYHQIWINSDTLPNRNEFTDFMVYIGLDINSFTFKFDVLAFTESLSDPADPNQLINEVVEWFYRIPLSQSAKDDIKVQMLLSGQTNDIYWTSAWNDYVNNPGPGTQAIVETRLTLFYKHIMNLEEYQLS